MAPTPAVNSPTPAPADTPPPWHVSRRCLLSFDEPRLLAILNLTPDSFSDGGELPTVAAAVDRAHAALAAGADMLDIGGESTRPGARRVDAGEQIRRVVPVIRAIRNAGLDAPISVDTTLAAVAEAALAAGADAINDVSAGSDDPQILRIASTTGAGLILMHRLLPPNQDVYSHQYSRTPIEGDIVEVVRSGLDASLRNAVAAGVPAESIALDPGLGFGKSVEQNLALMRSAAALSALGRPILFGASRKSFLGRLSGAGEPGERDAASAAATLLMYQTGARFFRVHDIGAHRQALRMAAAFAEV